MANLTAAEAGRINKAMPVFRSTNFGTRFRNIEQALAMGTDDTSFEAGSASTTTFGLGNIGTNPTVSVGTAAGSTINMSLAGRPTNILGTLAVTQGATFNSTALIKGVATLGVAGTAAGQADLLAPTAANGTLRVKAADLGAAFALTLTTSGTIAADRTCTLPVEDAAFQLLTTGATDQTLADGKDLAFGTTTGTKLGGATNQKLGFWNATPVVQQAHIADPAGGGTVDAEARTAINAINALCATLGLTAAA